MTRANPVNRAHMNSPQAMFTFTRDLPKKDPTEQESLADMLVNPPLPLTSKIIWCHGSFPLIAKANSQARCENFHPITIFESTRYELASWLLR